MSMILVIFLLSFASLQDAEEIFFDFVDYTGDTKPIWSIGNAKDEKSMTNFQKELFAKSWGVSTINISQKQ